MLDKFMRAFVRNQDGSWFCRDVVHVRGPHGQASTTPGVTYRKGSKLLNGQYDVAEWLDQMSTSGQPPVGIEFL
jgi:hypothetical protein